MTGLFASIGNTHYTKPVNDTPRCRPRYALCVHTLCLSAPLAAAIHSLGHPKHNRSLSAGGTRAPHVYTAPPRYYCLAVSRHTHTAGVRGRSRSPRPRRLLACCCCLVPLECSSSSSLSTSSCQPASLSLSLVFHRSHVLSQPHTHTHKHKRAKPHAHKKRRRRGGTNPSYPTALLPQIVLR